MKALGSSDQMREIRSKIEQNQNKLNEARAESRGLKNDISAVDGSIAANSQNVAVLNEQISIFQADIQRLALEIGDSETNINKNKKELKQLIVLLYEQEKVSSVEMLASSSITEVMNAEDYNKEIQDKVNDAVNHFKQLREKLDAQKRQQEQKKSELDAKKAEIDAIQAQLFAQREYKNHLLAQTQGDEARYSALINKEKQALASMQTQASRVSRVNKGTVAASRYIWPAQGRLTAPFGYSSYYFPGVFHTGIDIANSTGTPIKSATNGVVADVVYSNSGYGNHIKIWNGNDLIIYGHLSSIAVSDGQRVSQGQYLGGMGSTGNSTGPHLHFEIRLNGGSPVNPMNYLP